MLQSWGFILRIWGAIKGFQQGNHLMRFMLLTRVEDGMLRATRSSWDRICSCFIILGEK